MEKEIWKSLIGYEGRYEVSNLGRVKSNDYPSSCGTLIKGKLFKLTEEKKGYLIVFIRKPNCMKGEHFKVHRLVAELFVLNTDNKPYVNHINGIKTDNRAVNLEWCTNYENYLHARKHGLFFQFGETHNFSKLCNEQVLGIFNSNLSNKELKRKYNISESCISSIKSGHRWSAITGKVKM